MLLGSRRPRLSRRPALWLGALSVSALVGGLAGAPAAGAASTTKTYTTPGTSSFTVPDNVATIAVTAIGAAGGVCEIGDTAGEGATLTATLPVKPGATLFVQVGGVGNGTTCTSLAGGVGGGGAGALPGAGGGGASGLGLTSVAAGTGPLIVAGGGGGAGACGGGGGNAGSPGTGDTACIEANTGAGGGAGTQTSGGAGGAGGSANATAGTAGTPGQGGNGGPGDSTGPSDGGGGGGGGYYGGGGGGGSGIFSASGGGGGGSSFTAGDATIVSSATPTSASAEVTISYSAAPAPKVKTDSARGVKRTSATLHGSVNPEGLKTTYFFQYGRTKSYGAKTGRHTLKADTFKSKGVSASLHGLKAGHTYHFRVVATNASGTSHGRDMKFTTKAAAATAPPPFTG